MKYREGENAEDKVLSNFKYITIIHAFISDKSQYYTGYINYNHRLLILNYNKAIHRN